MSTQRGCPRELEGARNQLQAAIALKLEFSEPETLLSVEYHSMHSALCRMERMGACGMTSEVGLKLYRYHVPSTVHQTSIMNFEISIDFNPSPISLFK